MGLPGRLLLDLVGNARFIDDPGTPNTGVPGGTGGAIVVDMGAYEYADAPSCYADCDGDGRFTVFDFLCFQNTFAVGCP